MTEAELLAAYEAAKAVTAKAREQEQVARIAYQTAVNKRLMAQGPKTYPRGSVPHVSEKVGPK